MRDDCERLIDIQEAIERIEKYAMRGREAFERDELIQTWVLLHHSPYAVKQFCGSGRLTCGEPAAHRQAVCRFFEAVPRTGGVAATFIITLDGKAEPFRTSGGRSRKTASGELHHLQVIGEAVRALSPELTRETFGSRLVENRRDEKHSRSQLFQH